MICVNQQKRPQVSSKSKTDGRIRVRGQQSDAVGKHFIELCRDLKAGCFAIATTLPKGTLEVVRIELNCLDRIAEHGRIIDDLKAHVDAFAWPVLRDSRPMNGSALANGSGHLRNQEQQPQIAAAPLSAAVFEGYPGVLLAYRGSEDRAFSSDDLERLTACAQDISESLRKSRQQDAAANAAVAAGDMPVDQRFIALDADNRPWMKADEFNAMDEQLRANLLEALSELPRSAGDDSTILDTAVADSLNRLRTVRIVMRSAVKTSLNGHSSGSKSRKESSSSSPQVLCCFTPPASDWMRLRPEDFTADAEIKRLVPAIDFMTRDVGDQPGLFDIADSVNLSPFHFHRRFTELFGVTPKHLLLSAQIAHARQLLSQPDQALAEIARVCGFAHQSHFTSRFKQATGLTPTRWRRMVKAEGVAKSAEH